MLIGSDYAEVIKHPSSRLILRASAPGYVHQVATVVRSFLCDLKCLSYYCTCYINDPEKLNQEDKNRVHAGVIWSDEVRTESLDELRLAIIQKCEHLVSLANQWEHFDNSECSFVIHCLAREYGDFLLSASGTLEAFVGNGQKVFWDGLHLIYNQLLFNHENLSPQIIEQAFLEGLHAKIHK